MIDLKAVATQAAINNGIEPSIYHALIQKESGWDSGAISDKGAVGIAQILPSTAWNPGYGVKPFDPYDPVSAINGGAEYLAAMIRKNNGDVETGLNAYNAGNNNDAKYGLSYGADILKMAKDFVTNPVVENQDFTIPTGEKPQPVENTKALWQYSFDDLKHAIVDSSLSVSIFLFGLLIIVFSLYRVVTNNRR